MLAAGRPVTSFVDARKAATPMPPRPPQRANRADRIPPEQQPGRGCGQTYYVASFESSVTHYPAS